MPALLLPIIYLAFISLGLPDSLLGSVWPMMHADLGVTLSAGGVVSMVVAGCTIVSSLMTDRLVRRLGTGRLTVLSVGMTALALVGFSSVGEFWQLVLWAVPYGLGAGAVDAALNSFVALHYEARHMNWLHCFWGIGASAGPVIMGMCMGAGVGWAGGYRVIACVQAALVIVLLVTLGLWRASSGEGPGGKAPRSIPRSQLLRRPGVVQVLVAFFCYSAIEASCGLWGASFMVAGRGIAAGQAALLISLFYLGITAGRLVSGLLTLRLDGRALLRLGYALIGSGALVMALAQGASALGAAFVLVGLGCAPIYPQIIQLTPTRFGEDVAPSLMGVQMACAYLGSTFFPPIAGLIIQNVSAGFLPCLVAALLAAMAFSMERCDRLASMSRSADR
ncbi:MAG: MFS transporter [Atopobiaceae bacterium]|jgi:fucose permease